jgi:hypothetical protein
MADVIITNKMVNDGYTFIVEKAKEKGYGFAISMINEDEVKPYIAELYRVMANALAELPPAIVTES